MSQGFHGNFEWLLLCFVVYGLRLVLWFQWITVSLIWVSQFNGRERTLEYVDVPLVTVKTPSWHKVIEVWRNKQRASAGLPALHATNANLKAFTCPLFFCALVGPTDYVERETPFTALSFTTTTSSMNIVPNLLHYHKCRGSECMSVHPWPQ